MRVEKLKRDRSEIKRERREIVKREKVKWEDMEVRDKGERKR